MTSDRWNKIDELLDVAMDGAREQIVEWAASKRYDPTLTINRAHY